MSALQPLLPMLCLALLVCVVIQFVLIATLNRRFAAHTRMLRQFFTGPNDEDLQAVLEQILAQAQAAKLDSQTALTRIHEANLKATNSIQHFALIRYDAFEDVTGQQSFSVALLDGRDNGAIISSIFGRSNSRCFGKSIVGGIAEQPLSDEEQKALFLALQRKVQGDNGKSSHLEREKIGAS